jgi:hypothetical protein
VAAFHHAQINRFIFHVIHQEIDIFLLVTGEELAADKFALSVVRLAHIRKNHPRSGSFIKVRCQLHFWDTAPRTLAG